MKTFTKHILLLALMLFGVAGAAWASRAPQKWTGPVAKTDLVEGDTLAPGFSITGLSVSQNLGFNGNRYKQGGVLGTGEIITNGITVTGYGGDNPVAIIISETILVTPVDESGQDGNAWVVTYSSGAYLIISGIYIAPDPYVPALDETTGNWSFLMPGSNKVVKVTYKALPGLAWTYNSAAMPAEGLTAYRGFELPVIGGIGAIMDHDFLTALLGGTVSLRYGSTNPAVISFTDPNDMYSFSVNGAGECDVYMVFDGNDDFQDDSVAFHAVIANPATLTLAKEGNGTVSALLGGATWTTETWANLPSDQNLSPLTFGDITISTTGSLKKYSDYNPGKLSFFVRKHDDAETLTFSSEGGNFSRIEMTMVSEYSQYNPDIIPADGWTFHGHTAVWEGDAPSVTVTSCSTYVDQITFSRGIDSIVASATEGQYLVIPGATVQVVATAVDGAHVSAWSPINRTPENLLSDTATFTVGETMTVTATFAENPLLTLTANDTTWGKVTLDGVTPGVTTYNITISENPYPDVTYTNVTFPFHATVFIHEGLDGVEAGEQTPLIAEKNGNSADITINGPYGGTIEYSYNNHEGAGVKAIFCTAVEGLPIMPEGVTYAGYGNYLVLPGTQLKVIATPDSAHYFVNWNEETALNSNTAVEKTLTMGTDDINLTANFEHKPTLTVVCNGNEKGTMELTEVPPVTLLTTINSNSTSPQFTSGSRTFDNIATVTFSANVEHSNNDWGWWSYSGNSTMTVSAAEGYTITRVRFFCKQGAADDSQAPFEAILKGGNGSSNNTYMIVGNARGRNGVTKIEVYGYCNSCPPTHLVNVTDSTYLVDYGTTVRATATAKDGYHMDSWSNGAEVTDLLVNSNTVTVTTDSTIRANFIANPLLTLASNNSEWGSVTLDGVTYDTVYNITFVHSGSPEDDRAITIPASRLPYDTTFSYSDDVMDAIASEPSGKLSKIAQGDHTVTVSISGAFEGYGNYSCRLDGMGGFDIWLISCEDSIVTVYPDGIAATETDNTYRVLPGAEVKVIATPDSAHYFVNWTDSAAVNSNIGDTNTLTMGTDDTELTANFALKPTLTLVHNDGGEMEAIVPQAEPVLLTTITPTSIDSYDETTPGAVNVILDGQLEYDNTNGWQAEYGVGYQGSVTVTANPGFSIDSCKFYVGEFSYTVTAAPFTVYPFCEGSMQYVYTLPNAQGIYVGYYGVTRIEVYTATRPNVIASSTPNTYYVDYNTSVTVKATPSDTAYLVRFDQDADTNSNTAVEKTYGPLTANDTARATFAAKPVLTLAANDTSWGSVSVANGNEVENMSIGVGGSLYTGTHFTLAYTAHKDYTHGVAGFTIKENQDATLTATDGKVIRKVVLSNLTGNAYNESTTSSTGTIETERFGSTITINDVNATELVISNSYSSGVTATSVAVYYEGEELPAGVTQLTDSTYLVDYGTTLTVQADATALHHVANWVNEDSVAYPADSITYSAYFVTEPEPLFPALSTLTLTMTADTTTEALFGINSYDVAVTIAETEDLRGTVTISYTDINDVAHTVYAPDTVTVRGDTVATLVATAEYGYHFVRWTDTTGIVLGTLDTLRVTAAANVVAYFDTNAYEVRTLLTDASDGRESTFSGPDTVKHFTSGTVTAHAAYGYHLVNWTNAADSVLGTDTNLVVTPISDTTLYATFTKNVYYISVMVDTAQSYSRTTHTALYLENVSLPVIPKYGYHFVMWSDSVTANPRSITVTGNAVYHGLLAPNKYTVSATADSNRGTFAGTGSVDYLYNDTLRAIGNHGYRFDHWNDGSTENPRIVTVTKDTAFTAYFVIDQFTVTVKSADTTMGTAAGTATVDYGTEVTISATAKEHYHFVKWNDGNTNATRTVTANDDVTYTASFAPDSYTVTGLADQGQGSVTGSGSYAYLATATLTAVPACGYLFDHWSNQSTASTLTFQVTGPTTLTAYFRPTVVDTVTIHDTTVVEIHDTTVVAVDTMYIPVPDTTLVPVTVYDTTVVPVTEYDTTLVPVVINDTTIVPVVIIDSTLVPVIVPDTTLVPVTVYDTTTVPVTWYDTTVVPVTWYDTTHVPVTWYDTTVVPVTIVDTTLMPVVVPDTTFVPVTVYDTTIVPVTWYDTTHVDVTEYDTTHVDVTVVDSTLVPIHDTVIEYIEVHDTLWLVEYIYDTVYIHDTIIITGVDDVDVLDAKIYADHGEVVVEGANYERVMLFDAVGRLVAVKQDEGQIVRFGSLASGAYLVKIGNHPARRVVVIR